MSMTVGLTPHMASTPHVTHLTDWETALIRTLRLASAAYFVAAVAALEMLAKETGGFEMWNNRWLVVAIVSAAAMVLSFGAGMAYSVPRSFGRHLSFVWLGWAHEGLIDGLWAFALYAYLATGAAGGYLWDVAVFVCLAAAIAGILTMGINVVRSLWTPPLDGASVV